MSYQEHARSLRSKLINPPNAWKPEGIQIPQRKSSIIRIEPIRSSKIALEVMCEFAAYRLNVSKADVLSPSRAKQPALARHLICYLAAAHFGMTLYKIGDFLGRNYTSVMSGRNRMAAFLKKEGAPYERLREIAGEFLELYYPAFAIPNISKQDLEGQGKGSVSKRGIHSMESRSGGRVVKTKGPAAIAYDPRIVPPASDGAAAGQEAPGLGQP